MLLMVIHSYGTIRTAETTGGAWTSTSTWVGGVVPVVGDTIIIPASSTVSYTGSLSLTSGKLTIEDGGQLDVSSAFTGNVTTVLDGTLTVGSTYICAGGDGITIGSTGLFVAYSSASISQVLTVDGSFRISGNLTYTGSNTCTVNGSLIIGGNSSLDATVPLVVGSSGLLGTYGEATISSSSNNDDGKIVSLGYVASCASCAGSGDNVSNPYRAYATTDAVFDAIPVGFGQIWWADFTTDDHTTNNWSLISPATVSSGTLTANNTSTSPIWETGEISTSCYSGIQVSARVYSTVSGTLAKLQLQYSVYTDAGGWSDFTLGTIDPTTNDSYIRRVTGLTGTKIKLRLMLLDMITTAFTLDNVSIAGTLTLGDALATPTLASGFDNTSVCATEQVRYELTDSYDSYSWEADDNGTPTTGSSSNFNVTWAGVEPMNLSITVGNGCGRSELVTWPVTASVSGLKVSLIDYVDLTCYSSPTGELEVQASCGVEPYTYDWGAALGAQRYDSRITGLSKATYTVTVTDDVGSSVVGNFTVDGPDLLEAELAGSSVTSSCNSTIGCNGIAEFNIQGGDGNYTYSLTGGPSGGFTIKQRVVVQYYSEYYTVSGYQLPIEITGSQYPGMAADYSDVRFFADADFTTSLPFWLDENSIGSSATFYVKVDLTAGATGEIYFTYGDPSLPGNSSLTDVLDIGNMFVQVYNTPYWSGTTIKECEDNSTTLNYNWPQASAVPITIGTSCSTGLDSQDDISLIWSGWYTMPSTILNGAAADILKIVTSTTGNDGTVIFKINGSSISLSQMKTRTWNYDVSSYKGQTVTVEIYYSKPASYDGIVEVGFSNNTGSGLGPQDRPFYPDQAWSRKLLDPEPSVTLIKSAKYTGLCESQDPNFYTFTVTDGSGCTTNVNFEIFSDAIQPTWDVQPGTYNALISEADIVTETLYFEAMKNLASSHNGWAAYRSSTPAVENWADFTDIYSDLKYAGGQNSYIEKNFDTQGFSAIKVQLEVYQSSDANDGWDPTDYIQIEYSLDLGSNWSTLLTDYEIWNAGATPDPENFPLVGDGNGAGDIYLSGSISGAEENADFMVRIRCNSSETDENYYLQSFAIIGDNLYTVSPDRSDYATVVAADADDTEVTFRDYITGSCNNGYAITRTWTATDDCGNTNTYDQTINIGGLGVIEFEDPDPNASRDFTYPRSFCRDTVKLTVPAINTGCSGNTIYYLLDHDTDNKVAVSVASGQQETITIPRGATTTISWYAIDGDGYPIESAYYYDVTITSELAIPVANWNYNADFCTGDPVTVDVTPTGGSGIYSGGLADFDFSTSPGGSALVEGDDEDGNTSDDSFTSSAFVDGDYIYVSVTDDQGCSSNDNSTPGDFESPDPMVVRPQVVTPVINYSP